MISEDYKNYEDFLSNEEFFYNKLVNLQIPYFFLTNNKNHSLNDNTFKKEKINKYNKETEVNLIMINLLKIFLI